MDFVRLARGAVISALVATWGHAAGAGFGISGVYPGGVIAWTNAFTNGVCTIEGTSSLGYGGTTAWRPMTNYFTSTNSGTGVLPVTGSNAFFRLLAVDVSSQKPQGYTNLLHSYGTLRTIAGNGAGSTSGVNYWQPGFEGGYATNAALSRPHMAMADNAGNVYIVDKDSHSVLKVTPEGRIYTVAGTHTEGNGPDSLTKATQVALSQPNGLDVHGDGSFHILDTGNGKIRLVDTNGMISTLLTVPGGIAVGRGLWVSHDQTDAFFCSGTTLMGWHATNGFVTLNTNFVDLGNIHVTSPKENVYATDRGDDKVWKVDTTGNGTGTRTLVWGQGHGNPVVDGTYAATNCLNGVRGIWKCPTDGWLLALHEGDDILYVDPAGIVHVLVRGATGAHSGNGEWFYSPGDKIEQARSVSMDNAGNILIVESDAGYVRRIDFQRLSP